MKGVVLAAGAGSRLRPLTFSLPKHLVPVANKPVLFYVLEDLAAARVEEVALVVSPETGHLIRDYAGDGERFGLDLRYVVQDRPLGLAHGLQVALDFIDGDDVVMYLGDNLIGDGIGAAVDAFREEGPSCQVLLKRVDDPRSFGVAEVDGDGRVTRVVEKPIDPASDLALVGVYIFDHRIAGAIDAIRPSARGELEITDAIQHLVATGADVRATVTSRWWKDTGRKADLLHANELVLAGLSERIDGQLGGCRVRGQVVVEAGSRLEDCELVGPLVVGAGVTAVGSVIGPNTAVGEGTELDRAVVERSILLSDVVVRGWRLRNSLLGRACVLDGPAPAGFVEVTMGDKTGIYPA